MLIKSIKFSGWWQQDPLPVDGAAAPEAGGGQGGGRGGAGAGGRGPDCCICCNKTTQPVQQRYHLVTIPRAIGKLACWDGRAAGAFVGGSTAQCGHAGHHSSFASHLHHGHLRKRWVGALRRHGHVCRRAAAATAAVSSAGALGSGAASPLGCFQTTCSTF